MKTVRPDINDPKVKKILDALNAESEPIILKVTASKNAEPNECFVNVENEINQFGGKMILGYQIWQNKYFMTAETHAVWEDDKQNLYDITPKQDNIKSIIFVKDRRIKYEGKQINNLRLNITKNELVDYLIDLHDIYFSITNKGDRANQYFLIIFTPEENIYLELIENCENGIHKMIELGEDIKSGCFCEKANLFKDCHGELIKGLKEKYIQ